MNYKEVKPHPILANYIDAFWTSTNDEKGPVSEKILPDGCVDLILNLGEDCKTDNGRFDIKNGETCLVGTMRHFKTSELKAETKLLGIRFKPSAFSAFYKFSSLHEVTDNIITFERKLSPDFNRVITGSINYLNQFFIENLVPHPTPLLMLMVEDIKKHKGTISVVELANRHFTTTRQLERYFKQHIGISPKEFINIIRFQFVHAAIRKKSSDKSMLEIAFEYGYYDHAHLANAIKTYTGVTPKEL